LGGDRSGKAKASCQKKQNRKVLFHDKSFLKK